MTDFDAITTQANAAADDARLLRESLRHTTTPGEPDREQRLTAAIAAIDEAMKPVRAEIGRLPWVPQPESVADALREASAACQYQRRQLKRMRR